MVLNYKHCGNLSNLNLMFYLLFQKTFHYNSHFWSDRNGYNLAGGRTGFDFQETKLPTYWNTPFSKICLGMKIGHQINFIVINKQANSLYSLIADGKYRATSLGRNTWKTLVGSQASLQLNCNKEGFNAVVLTTNSKTRIGIIGNEQNDCNSCDSRIGFGTGGYPDDSNTCGNEALHSPDNGDKHIKAMGYILVQWEELFLAFKAIQSKTKYLLTEKLLSHLNCLVKPFDFCEQILK